MVPHGNGGKEFKCKHAALFIAVTSLKHICVVHCLGNERVCLRQPYSGIRPIICNNMCVFGKERNY